MTGIWQGSLLHLFKVSISSLEDRRESVLAGFIEELKLRGTAGTHLQERHHPCITAGALQVLALPRYKHHVEEQLSELPHPTCTVMQTQCAGSGAVTRHQGCAGRAVISSCLPALALVSSPGVLRRGTKAAPPAFHHY